MNPKKRFIDQLKRTADVFKPYITPGYGNTKRVFIPHALCWWSVIMNTAELLDREQVPLSKKQLEYVRQILVWNGWKLERLWLQ